MHHKIHLSWLISCVTLMLSGRLSKPQLTLPTHTQLEPAQTVAPLKPRPIEEWTEPSAQEVARQLLAIDRHRSLLNSLVENLSTAQLSGELPHKERLISQLSGNIARVTWYPPIAIQNRWEGRVEIDVWIRDNGEFVWACVSKGSGNPVLDHTAIETVRLAFPLRLTENLARPLIRVRVRSPTVFIIYRQILP